MSAGVDVVALCLTCHSFRTAPAKLHPTSRVIVGFYAVCVSFDIAVFKRRCFQKSRSDSQLIMEAANEAINILEYIINSLVPHDVLSFAPDIVPIKAARSAVFLVTVS